MNTNEKVKRRINYRPLLWLFLFAVVAIFATANIFLGRVWIFIAFCILIAVILILLIMTFFKKDFLKIFAIVFNIKNLKIFFASLLICGILFSGLTAINFVVYSQRTFSNSLHSVIATVREVVTYEDKQSVLLGDVIVDGEKQSFNIKATCENEVAILKVGDKIDVNMYLFANKLTKNGDFSTNCIKNKIFYYASINSGVYITNGKAHLVDYFKDNIKNLYITAFDDDISGLSFAVTMGDKSLLSEVYYKVFQQSGLAHILAVSGLHVGFLVAVIIWLTKLIKIKAKYRFWIVAIILIIYNIVCGFSPSVFRASIMSLCLLFGLIIGERNDSLSNLSLAGLVVLLTQPFNLFDVGFLLSFSAVFGILFFQKKISNLIQKAKINKIIADPIALTISATIGTFPFVCKYFGYIAPISIFSNLIVLPIFALFYYIFLPSTILAIILGPKLLVVANFFANCVFATSSLFARFGTIDLIKFDTLCCIGYFFVIYFISPYFMLSAKKKFLCALAMIVAICPLFVFANTETRFDYNSISVCERANDTALFTTQNDQKILLNVGKNKTGFANLKTMLSKKKIKNIDFLILVNYQSDYFDYLEYIVSNYNIKQIVILDNLALNDRRNVEKVVKNAQILYKTEQNFELSVNIRISTYVDGDKFKAINLQTFENNYLVILGAVSASNLSSNTIFEQNFDAVVTNSVTDLRYESLTSNNYLTFSTTFYDNYFVLIDDLWTIKV